MQKAIEVALADLIIQIDLLQTTEMFLQLYSRDATKFFFTSKVVREQGYKVIIGASSVYRRCGGNTSYVQKMKLFRMMLKLKFTVA